MITSGPEPGAAGDPAPAAARPAATLVLVREGPGGPETLLVGRSPRAGFAPNTWVFPGGVVDEGDGLFPETPAEVVAHWCKRTGMDPTVAAAYICAALRETWEETGIVVGFRHDELESLARTRIDVLEGRASFGEVVASPAFHADPSGLIYIGHWITPTWMPRRYDTRFFLAVVAVDTVATLSGEELTEALWIEPTDALARFHAGELPMLPPTVHTLRRLSGYATTSSMIEALRDAPVPCYLPDSPSDVAALLGDGEGAAPG